jgi:branched-chain amino acid transport system ATP-binding protein
MFELSGISAGYGETTVLREVDLMVPASSVVALLGPNGAGKTTLLRVACGLLRPSAGAVRLAGTEITALPPPGRTALGCCFVPGGRGTFPSLTVRENLGLFARRDGALDGIERAVEAFPRLGERLGQLAGTLSGGEQQMLGLARAYLQNPRIVLLDEVSMGLAPKVIEEIFLFLRRLADDGVSLLVVEQYVNLALEFADQVSILNRGRITFAGDPADLAGEDIFDHYVAAPGFVA